MPGASSYEVGALVIEEVVQPNLPNEHLKRGLVHLLGCIKQALKSCQGAR